MRSPQLLEKAIGLVEQFAICNRCLGRQFAWLSTNSTNESRGYSLKLAISMIADQMYKMGEKERGLAILQDLARNGMFSPAVTLCKKYGSDIEHKERCQLCAHGDLSIFEGIPLIVERAIIESKGYEFDTFLVGSSMVKSLEELNEEIQGKFGLVHAETLKSDFNRELGKQLSDKMDWTVNFERPDIVIFYDMKNDRVEIRSNPVFIYGRYCKLVRGIPQSRWDCKICKGKGCGECGGTGRNYPDSISEYISIPIQEALKGTRFKFHAAGREDVDVLMLGNGRPFVVEITKPRTRHPDFEVLTRTINSHAHGKIKVHSLELTTRKKLQSLKTSASETVKEYRALIHISGEVSAVTLQEAMERLTGATLDQRTPHRVSHRRSDLVRKKQVFEVRLVKKDAHTVDGFFKVQGGTYVKELISGDDGRTSPSLTEMLGTECKCVELNVTAVHS